MTKLQSSLLSLFVAAAGMTAAQLANAADGTITFTGEVKANTCTITGGGAAGANFAVPLPPVGLKSLANVGDVAGSTSFTIELSDCDPASGNVQTVFEAGSNIDVLTNQLRLDAASTAGNVQVRLLNGDDSSLIKLGLGGDAQNSKSTPMAGAKASLKYIAQYAATGAATPGTVNTSVTYSIVYR